MYLSVTRVTQRAASPRPLPGRQSPPRAGRETGESHIALALEKPKESTDTPPPARQEKFEGRSALVRLPANGFPETLLTRAGGTFYRLALRGNVVIMAGGEQGDIRAYDLVARNRYRWFGRANRCLLPTADLARHFLAGDATLR